MQRRRRIRQKDVAQTAGVSSTIVSHVVNGKLDGNVRISDATQQRVWEAIKQLGYVPNPVAQGLRTGQNHLLGVFTYEAIFPLQSQNFYFPFLIGIEEEAENQDYNLLFFTRPNGPNRIRSVYRDGANQLLMADGAILIGTNEKRDELSKLLQEGFPFVYIGRREVAGGEMSYVAADYAEATAEIVTHMIHLGHRKIAYICGAQALEQGQDREHGYWLGHERMGLQVNPEVILRLSKEMVTAELLQRLLQEGVTGFLAENDSFLRKILAAAQALQKYPPENFSLAVLGDPHDANDFPSEVTTFRIPRREMGIEAVRLLTRMLSQPEVTGPHRNTLSCTFIKGSTVAAPPRMGTS